MSRRLTPVKREQFIRRLRELGFDGPFPNPHHGEISVDLLRRILRDSGISREEWLGDP